MARARTLSQPPEGTRPATVRRRDRPALESDLYISGAGRTPRTPQEFRRGRRTAGPELLGGRSTWAGDRFVRDEVLGILGPASRCESDAPGGRPCPFVPSPPRRRPARRVHPARGRPPRHPGRRRARAGHRSRRGAGPCASATETASAPISRTRPACTRPRPLTGSSPTCVARRRHGRRTRVRPRPADGARPEGAAVTTVSTAPAAAPPHTAHRQLPRAGEERTSRIA